MARFCSASIILASRRRFVFASVSISLGVPCTWFSRTQPTAASYSVNVSKLRSPNRVTFLVISYIWFSLRSLRINFAMASRISFCSFLSPVSFASFARRRSISTDREPGSSAIKRLSLRLIRLPNVPSRLLRSPSVSLSFASAGFSELALSCSLKLIISSLRALSVSLLISNSSETLRPVTMFLTLKPDSNLPLGVVIRPTVLAASRSLSRRLIRSWLFLIRFLNPTRLRCMFSASWSVRSARMRSMFITRFSTPRRTLATRCALGVISASTSSSVDKRRPIDLL